MCRKYNRKLVTKVFNVSHKLKAICLYIFIKTPIYKIEHFRVDFINVAI